MSSGFETGKTAVVRAIKDKAVTPSRRRSAAPNLLCTWFVSDYMLSILSVPVLTGAPR